MDDINKRSLLENMIDAASQHASKLEASPTGYGVYETLRHPTNTKDSTTVYVTWGSRLSDDHTRKHCAAQL